MTFEQYVNSQLSNKDFRNELKKLYDEDTKDVLDEDINRTFIETQEFKEDWNKLNLTDNDLQDLQNDILQEKGLIPVGGQLYKIKFSSKILNKGKSTSDRTIFTDITKKGKIYLLKVFSKGKQTNITTKELDILKEYSRNL